MTNDFEDPQQFDFDSQILMLTNDDMRESQYFLESESMCISITRALTLRIVNLDLKRLYNVSVV